MRRVLFAIVVLLISTCAFAWPRLHLGSRGFEVEALQHLLNAKGADLTVDGTFGPKTAFAIRKYGSLLSIGVDDEDWLGLCPTLKIGSQGDSVKALQVLLTRHNHGYLEIDGDFNWFVGSAVYDFQLNFGLEETGVVGNETWRMLFTALPKNAGTVQDAINAGCSTTAVAGLNKQLVFAINTCYHSGVLQDISSTPKVIFGSAVFPYMQQNAKTSFNKAMTASSRTLTMNSAYRTLAQQLMLYKWYLAGRCGISLAAKPGTSNHETGIAFDCNDGSSWQSHFSQYSFKWLGSQDPPHYDYTGSGNVEIRPSSIKGFQRLWNTNNPNDRIAEDGLYGPDTESRLLKSPAGGFAQGIAC